MTATDICYNSLKASCNSDVRVGVRSAASGGFQNRQATADRLAFVCAMDSTTLLQEFEDLAERMSIRVRYGKLDGDGGLCRYRGRYHIVINKRLDTDGRINLLGRAFSEFPLENVFLIPAVREAIDRNRSGSEIRA